MHSKFSCVRSSHDLCARAHMHSLEGTLLAMVLNSIVGGIVWCQNDTTWAIMWELNSIFYFLTMKNLTLLQPLCFFSLSFCSLWSIIMVIDQKLSSYSVVHWFWTIPLIRRWYQTVFSHCKIVWWHISSFTWEAQVIWQKWTRVLGCLLRQRWQLRQ